MSYQILSATVASISELKRDPLGTLKKGHGSAVAILKRNEPAFYCGVFQDSCRAKLF